MDSTILTVNWYPPIGQNVDFYTFSCSLNDEEVLSLDITIRSLVLGIYEPDATYVCTIWYTTTSGETGPIINKSVTTGGEHISDWIWENPTFLQILLKWSVSYHLPYSTYILLVLNF